MRHFCKNLVFYSPDLNAMSEFKNMHHNPPQYPSIVSPKYRLQPHFRRLKMDGSSPQKIDFEN